MISATGHEVEPNLCSLFGHRGWRPLAVSVLALKLDHEDRSHPGDRPPHSDICSTVHLAHDPLQNSGAKLGAPLVAKEKSAGSRVGKEGEHLALPGTQVVGRGLRFTGVCVVDEVTVGGQCSAVVVVAVGGGEQRLELAAEVVGELVGDPVAVARRAVETVSVPRSGRPGRGRLPIGPGGRRVGGGRRRP